MKDVVKQKIESSATYEVYFCCYNRSDFDFKESINIKNMIMI
jgi:hypothetical protein